jgi:phosphate transport system permease protein
MKMTLKRTRLKREIIDRLFHFIFFLAAIVSVLSVVLIIIFIVSKGIQPFLPNNEFIKQYIDDGHINEFINTKTKSYRLLPFLTGSSWHPNELVFGIGFMIISSIYGTIGALVLGVPIALFTAIFISEVAPPPLTKVIRPAIEMLAAIPSVLYGVFGYSVIVPLISNIRLNVMGSTNSKGDSLLAVTLILTMMILPTVISVCETAIRSVPQSYKEGSLALGATKMQTIFKVTIPAAKSGILTGIVLGVGRAIGETMAVILVAGNPEEGVPTSLLDSVRLLTTNIALEQGYASELHEQMLFSTAVVLFVFIIIVNVVLQFIKKKAGNLG